MRLTLAFMGTPEFAVPCLTGLIEAGHQIAAVYAQPPRPAGRGHRERQSAVAAFATERGLLVRCPPSLREPEVQRAFTSLDLDVAVVVAYGLLLPKEILDAPRLGCVNLHASLLPRWRGAAPIERAIQAGDAQTGLTLMRMEEGLDTGAILAADRVPIAPDETGGSLTAKLAERGRQLLPVWLGALAAGRLEARAQPSQGVTYAAKLSRAEARLDWRKSAPQLEREVRAFDPWPGCWFSIVGERIKALKCRLIDAEGAAAPGTVLGPGLTVACGSGALRLTQVQRSGRRPMSDEALLRGYPIPLGAVLP
ncbi:MAG TPA: methionyl-tRNA formyltransferase [Alphaproteobacteria bacterium]|nr:methionyl-tRNA formyltransferase [Alphaproteobacteria bacterium]